MRPQEIGIAERTEEIAWRHVWLKSVLIDAVKPSPNDISSSKGNKTTDTKAASGKASPYESGPRTTAIMDGKIVFPLLPRCQQTPWWQPFFFAHISSTCCASGPSYCCFSRSLLPLGSHQPKRPGSIGMTRQIQDIAKPHLPAVPWVSIFALRTQKEAAPYSDKN